MQTRESAIGIILFGLHCFIASGNDKGFSSSWCADVSQSRSKGLDSSNAKNRTVEIARSPLVRTSRGELHICVAVTGAMLFKDGFLYKTVSMKSISVQNIKPAFDELENFRAPSAKGEGEMVGLSTLFANRKKGHFMKGDAVIVVKGDLKNLKGWDEKTYLAFGDVLQKTLVVNEKELCKYFEPGNHVKVVAGTKEGATGMVVKVEQHIRVFADDVVESSEVTTGVTKIGVCELRDLMLLDNNSFGVIIRVEKEAFQVLKGVPERPEVSLVKLREIKCKLEKKFDVQDKYRNTVSVKDVVRILEGSCKGKQGPVEHIYKGILFVYDRHHLEHAGFICAKAGSCCVVGGSRSNGARNGDSFSRFGSFKAPPRVPPSPRRFSRGGPPHDSGGRPRGGRGGHDALVGTTVKIRQGPFKGYRGRVVDIKVALLGEKWQTNDING
ncbi:hypothetical protein V6N13_035527 [Hibiscus sabdariffa]